VYDGLIICGIIVQAALCWKPSNFLTVVIIIIIIIITTMIIVVVIVVFVIVQAEGRSGACLCGHARGEAEAAAGG